MAATRETNAAMRHLAQTVTDRRNRAALRRLLRRLQRCTDRAAKAKRDLGWELRYPSWRQGFVAAYASTTSNGWTDISPGRQDESLGDLSTCQWFEADRRRQDQPRAGR
ncbi:MAG: hypothetical protein ACR2NB_11210 [Solirubrobacteraceae bacterium]